MSRYDYLGSDSSLRATLESRNADELKKLLALLPDIKMKAPRKDELIGALERFLLGGGAVQLWAKLSALEQSAVAEAVHSDDGAFDAGAFQAKYGELPRFEIEEENNRWRKNPTLLGLFIHPRALGGRSVPDDLREKLRPCVPKPAASQLSSLEQIPERPAREWTSHYFDAKKGTRVYEQQQAPLLVRLTEQAAFQDLRTVLRLIDQEKISVSPKTLLPSKATMTLLNDLLREHDFFPLTAQVNSWDPEIGPVKAFSWPLLVQAAKLAALRDQKLLLTKTGRAALEAPPAQALRDVWNAWVTRGIIDEFSRIDTIKGQKGRRNGLTKPEDRRLTIKCALADCPVGRWVEVGELSRYMRAAGFRFEVTRNPWSLYLCDPQYGSLGYEGYGGWNILQERYLLCLLFEYAAPLGLIDVAYEHPAGARGDFKSQWGADDLIFLSRYDGLRYFRLTPLGAFILGRADHYESRKGDNPTLSLTVLPNRQIRLEEGELSPDQKLLLENFAEPQGAAFWVLDEARAIKSVEKGARIAEIRAFLAAGDPQPLPEAVEGFLAKVEQRGTTCICKGTALLIECVSPQAAEVIAHNPQTGKLCQRTGERGLVVPLDKEKAFRAALNAIGYGMPQV